MGNICCFCKREIDNVHVKLGTIHTYKVYKEVCWECTPLYWLLEGLDAT